MIFPQISSATTAFWLAPQRYHWTRTLMEKRTWLLRSLMHDADFSNHKPVEIRERSHPNSRKAQQQPLRLGRDWFRVSLRLNMTAFTLHAVEPLQYWLILLQFIAILSPLCPTHARCQSKLRHLASPKSHKINVLVQSSQSSQLWVPALRSLSLALLTLTSSILDHGTRILVRSSWIRYNRKRTDTRSTGLIMLNFWIAIL